MPLTLPSLLKRAEPHVAGISPEFAEHNESVKGQGLKMLLKILLGGATIGGGTALVASHLGKKKVPSADYSPDVDIGYPQLALKQGVDARSAFFPALYGPVGAAYGAVRDHKDPLAGAAYGGMQGLGRGTGAAAGWLAGSKGMGKLLEHTHTGGTQAEIAKFVAGLLGAAGGDQLGRLGTNALLKHTVGAPPWEKQSDWSQTLAHTVMPTPVGKPMPTIGSPGWMRGDSHHDIQSMPWFYPGAAAAGLGGLWAGNHMVRHIIKRHRKAKLDAEMAAAKKEYEDAMLGQYDPDKIHKLEDAKVAAAPKRLDDAFHALTKVGLDVNSLLGQGAGAYGAMALPLAGLVGYGTYKYLDDRSKSKLLADAIKQRALMREMSGPTSVFVHPVAAHKHHHHVHAEQEVDPLAEIK